MTNALFETRLLDKDATHRLRRGGKEVPTPAPLLLLTRTDKPQIGIVHQRGRLKRLAGLHSTQFAGSEFPQFFVDEWQKFARGTRLPTRGCHARWVGILSFLAQP